MNNNKKLTLNIPEEFNLNDIKNKKLEKIHNEAIKKYLNAKNTNELDEVILMLNRVILSDKENIIAMYNLGVCYSDIGNFDKSIELFEKVIDKLDNDKKNLLYESSLYNLANQYVFKKDFKKALELFEIILKHNPKSWDSLYNAGYICMNFLKEYDKAINYFETLIRFGSLNKSAIYSLAISYMSKGDFFKSIETFEYLMRLVPDFSYTYYNLGYLYDKISQRDKSYFYYDKFINLKKTSPDEYKLSKIARRRLREFENKK
jgi:tetratricopeptide (TPR) repeat protein